MLRKESVFHPALSLLSASEREGEGDGGVGVGEGGVGRGGGFKVETTEWVGQSTPGCGLPHAPPYLWLVTKHRSHLTRRTQKPKSSYQGSGTGGVGRGARGVEERRRRTGG